MANPEPAALGAQWQAWQAEHAACSPDECSVTQVLAELTRAHGLLDALLATVPVESAYTYPQCAYCNWLQTPTTTAHTATCPWGQARRYRDAARTR